MNRKALLLAVGLLMMASGAALAMSGGGYRVPWSGSAGGGDQRTAPQLRLRDSVGQGVVGTTQGGGSLVRAGFWNALPLTPAIEAYRIFWRAIAAGGRRSGESYRSGDAVGQAAVGRTVGGEFRVAAGYWPGAGVSEATATPTPAGSPTATATPTASATPTAIATATATPSPTPTPGGGFIAGQVDLQGRSNDGGALAQASGSAIYSATSASNGSFRIAAAPGSYTVTASLNGYLYARRGGVAVSVGVTTTLPSVRLLGGDAVADDTVNIYDLVAIGANFGTSNVAADISGDGAVNVYDLALVGANYGRAAPLAWP